MAASFSFRRVEPRVQEHDRAGRRRIDALRAEQQRVRGADDVWNRKAADEADLIRFCRLAGGYAGDKSALVVLRLEGSEVRQMLDP